MVNGVTARIPIAVVACGLLACAGRVGEGNSRGAPGAESPPDLAAPPLGRNAESYRESPRGGSEDPAGSGGTDPGDPRPGDAKGQDVMAPDAMDQGTQARINTVTCDQRDVGPTPLRRLTHREYDYSVRDLLGVEPGLGASFAPDTQVGLFDNTTSAQTVSVLLADQYLDAAEQLATVVDLDGLLGCDPSDDGCARGFIARFTARAYRRPLAAPELERLWSLFGAQRSSSNAQMAMRGVIAAVLSSPDFLFRAEGAGPPSDFPGARKLTPHELAARLSSLLWASVPDDELISAAEDGSLSNPSELERQTRRMLADSKARPATADFYYQWFGLALLETTAKDPDVYPLFDETLRASMAEETRRFIEHTLWDADGRLETLLTASYSFVNGPLATLYGLSAPSDPAEFQRTELDVSERRGLLSHASLMATFSSPTESSPIKRGKWVRVRLLCQDLPDPPADVPPLPEPEAGVSTRERIAMHTNNPACSGCHTMIDGLGFGLEHFDGIGAYRTHDHGAVVDASGEINLTRDIDGPYSGAPELAGILASSTQVRDCAPTQWLRYALGRREEAEDACSLVALREAFEATDGDLRELMVALVQTDAFQTYRAPL
ncbi:MAG: DUF1592 domain-containing protein [Myxococcales bacterium]|nr:DUF1592 domain-containing protein [Myxococcales bacterium]